MSDKELALETIRRLPENATMEEISGRIDFLAALRKGFEEIERGETVAHEDVKRELAQWLSK